MLAGRPVGSTTKSSPAWGHMRQGSLDAAVFPITHNHIKPPRLTKQGFVAGGAAAVAVADSRELGGTCAAGRGGLRKLGGGAGRTWWLWKWLEPL